MEANIKKPETNDEEKRIRRLQMMVDFTKTLLYQTNDGIANDFELIERVRESSNTLFPEKEKTFFLIYFLRLRRILLEKYGREVEYFPHPLNIKFEEYFGGINNEKLH